MSLVREHIGENLVTNAKYLQLWFLMNFEDAGIRTPKFVSEDLGLKIILVDVVLQICGKFF